MAEFQWWLLLVGLVAGGGIVAVVSMDGRRREQDVAEMEQRAEATWIADQLGGRGVGASPDPETVEDVLRAHRAYLSLPPPDRLIVEDEADQLVAFDLAGDAYPDRETDEVGDDGRGGADEDLAPAAEQEAPARQEAHAGADREQGRDR
jgi:hypothetical protein